MNSIIVDKSICWILKVFEYPTLGERSYQTDKVLSNIMIPIELSLNASEYDIAKARQLLKQAGEDAHEFFMEVFQLGLGPNFRLGAAHFTLSRSPKIDWQFIEQLVFGKIKSIYGFSQILRIQ